MKTIKTVHLKSAHCAAARRALDLAIAGLGLVVTLPLFAAIAVAIRLTSTGSVFFRQERVTRSSRTFSIYKFRTTVHSADSEADTTLAFYKVPNGPRLTRLGRFLRSTRLDKLPQLLNVIRGDMSLVGPRPLPVELEQELGKPEGRQ